MANGNLFVIAVTSHLCNAPQLTATRTFKTILFSLRTKTSKFSHTVSLWGEFNNDWGFPSQRASKRKAFTCTMSREHWSHTTAVSLSINNEVCMVGRDICLGEKPVHIFSSTILTLKLHRFFKFFLVYDMYDKSPYKSPYSSWKILYHAHNIVVIVYTHKSRPLGMLYFFLQRIMRIFQFFFVTELWTCTK